MAYDNIIFDWDGVIVQTPAIWHESIVKAGGEYGLTFTTDQIAVQSADLSNVLKHGLPKSSFNAYIARVRELALPRADKARLYPGAAKMLNGLKLNGKGLAIVSSRTINMREDVERRGMTHLFEIIVSGKDVTRKKPHPEGVLMALDAMGAAKRRTAFVGDSWTDLKAASSAGIHSILYYPKGHSEFHDLKELMRQKPTHVAKTHAQLGRLLA